MEYLNIKTVYTGDYAPIIQNLSLIPGKNELHASILESV